MPTWKHSTEIHASADKVFAYLDEPMNLVEWMVGMVEVRNVIGTGAGQQYDGSYKMGGIVLHGQATIIEHALNDYAVHQTIGAISSTWGFRLEPSEHGTQITIDVEYSIPIPIIGKLAERIVRSRNEREFRLSIENLKELLEA
jgi:carbon monoxide dehydrogenase subunit G